GQVTICLWYTKRNVRRFTRDALALLLCLRQSGFNKAKRDCVDLDVELTPFLRERLGNTDDTRLAGSVVCLAGVTTSASSRRYIHYLASVGSAGCIPFSLCGFSQVLRSGTNDPKGSG